MCIFLLWKDFTIFSKFSKMTWSTPLPPPSTAKFKNHCFKSSMARDPQKGNMGYWQHKGFVVQGGIMTS